MNIEFYVMERRREDAMKFVPAASFCNAEQKKDRPVRDRSCGAKAGFCMSDLP